MFQHVKLTIRAWPHNNLITRLRQPLICVPSVYFHATGNRFRSSWPRHSRRLFLRNILRLPNPETSFVVERTQKSNYWAVRIIGADAYWDVIVGGVINCATKRAYTFHTWTAAGSGRILCRQRPAPGDCIPPLRCVCIRRVVCMCVRVCVCVGGRPYSRRRERCCVFVLMYSVSRSRGDGGTLGHAMAE